MSTDFKLRTPEVREFYVNNELFVQIDRTNSETKKSESVVFSYDKLSDRQQLQYLGGCVQKAAVDLADMTQEVGQLKERSEKFSAEQRRQADTLESLKDLLLNNPLARSINMEEIKRNSIGQHLSDEFYHDALCGSLNNQPSSQSQDKQAPSFFGACCLKLKSFFSSCWQELMKLLSFLWGSCCGKE